MQLLRKELDIVVDELIKIEEIKDFENRSKLFFTVSKAYMQFLIEHSQASKDKYEKNLKTR